MKGLKRNFFVTLPLTLAEQVEKYCEEREITFNRFFRDLVEEKFMEEKD